MQGNAIKYLQEGNLAKLQQVTIELLEPGMGIVMGSIPDVNFVDGMNQVPAEESIGEMLSKLGLENPTPSEQNNEIDFDNDCYSMGKEKQGKLNPIPSPRTKAADKEKEKQKQKEKDKGKDKPKPPPKSRLGPTPPTAPLLSTTKLTTRQSARERSGIQSPEGAPLLTNPRINPTMGVLYTTEAERRAIKEILNKRNKRPLQEEGEEEEEMVLKKRKSPLRRTSRDLVVRKKTTEGGATNRRKRSGKGAKPTSKRKKTPQKKVPSKQDSGQKYAGRGSYSGSQTTGGFQHGPGYYYTDAKG